MKIQTITIKNLNSLYGEWTVDLEGNFGDSGLFLIHGATGAGKSTLMDAVSLALFATTPRLRGTAAGPEVAKEVMSRETGDCAAEVIFTRRAADGNRVLRFRAQWTARRAGGSPSGQMQAPRRTLAAWTQDGGWSVLNEKATKSESDRVIAEALDGFTVDEFQRSMLLAQGQFDKLLHASTQERAPILERLTNTSDYLTVGARAAKVGAAWRDRLKALEPGDASGLASSEELAALEMRVTRARERQQRLSNARAHLEKVHEWRERMSALEGDLEKALLRKDSAESAFEKHSESFRRLDEFRKAGDALTLLDQITNNESIRKEALGGREALREALQEARTRVAQTEAALETARNRLKEARGWDTTLEPLVTKVVTLQTQRASAARQRDGAVKRGAEIEEKRLREVGIITEKGAALEAAWPRLRGIPQSVPAALGALAANVAEPFFSEVRALPDVPSGAPTLEGVERSLAVVRKRLNAEMEKVGALIPALKAKLQAERDLQEAEKHRTVIRGDLDEATSQHRDAAEALITEDAHLAAARARFEPLDRLHTFATAGSALVAGDPCPVCGSCEHPAPRLTSALNEEYEAARDAVEKAKASLELARRDEATRKTGCATLSATLAHASTSVTALGERLKDREREVDGLLDLLDWTGTPSVEAMEGRKRDLSALVDLVDERWAQQIDDLIRTSAALRQAEMSLAGLEDDAKRAREEVSEAKKVLEKLDAAFDSARNAVVSFWITLTLGEPSLLSPEDPVTLEGLESDPQVPRNRLKGLITNLEVKEEQVETELKGYGRAASDLEKQDQEYTTRLVEAERNLSITRPKLDEQMQDLGLLAFAELEHRRIPTLEATRIETLRNELDRDQVAAQEAFKIAGEKLNEHRNLGDAHSLVTDMGTEELALRLERVGYRAECADRVQTKRSERVAIERDKREKWERAATVHAAESKRAEPWLALNKLIGVNDGKNFREFAQALNLDLLLDRANHHLTKLRDRYALRAVQDPDSGLPTLELEIEDGWRGNQRRSIKTLSGGESFLVSLALALGLSGLRTSSMPIETLLLDEGFGTLDPETLDTALKALEQLQGDGRQVGIISHVLGLEERIDRRIRLESDSQGRSRVMVETGALRVSS